MTELKSECTVGYGLDNRRIVVQFPEEATNYSVQQRVRIRSGSHTAFYTFGSRGCFPESIGCGVVN
jgi:hypothetical protein